MHHTDSPGQLPGKAGQRSAFLLTFAFTNGAALNHWPNRDQRRHCEACCARCLRYMMLPQLLLNCATLMLLRLHLTLCVLSSQRDARQASKQACLPACL